MGDPLVLLEDVSVRAGPTPILVGVSLRLDPGEVVGVAGPNGAGKSTLLGLVATLVPPASGSGRVLDARLGTEEVRKVRRRIGWSGHDPGLYPELTLRENLLLAAGIAGIPSEEVDRALGMVGLAGAAGRKAERSSNGMQRRVDLARLLLTRPDLVLLDEAQAGLDTQAERILDEVVDRARSGGGAALLVSHDATSLARRVDRLVRLEEGRLPG